MSARNEFGVLINVVIRRYLAEIKRMKEDALSPSEKKFIGELKSQLKDGRLPDPEQDHRMSDIYRRFSTVRTGGTGQHF